ncbi:MAG TPA: hypothetical protein VHO06_11500 [Polyangia bacterium]|nr:hypothetical protein [Polyangia bacterium]
MTAGAVLIPLIGVRLHGWLDELVALVYLLGVALLGLSDGARAAALAAAAVHFTLTRLTRYPRGTFKLIPFRAHAFIELGEGLGLLGAALALPAAPAPARVFLALMGLAQVGAFAFSDYAGPA